MTAKAAEAGATEPLPQVSTARAAWRVVATVLHILHGVGVVSLTWHRLDLVGRQARIAWWSRGVIERLGMGLSVQGQAQAEPALVVANHVSWLDIMVVHAVMPQARFVAKSDVRSWPVLGWLMASVGTLFIERGRPRDAVRVRQLMTQALQAGETVAVFPEGTTGTGPQVLPFHANLLQAAVASAVPVQPVALRFSAPGQPYSATVSWIGDETLAASIWAIAKSQGLCAHAQVLQRVDPAGLDRRVLAGRLHQILAAAVRHDATAALRHDATPACGSTAG